MTMITRCAHCGSAMADAAGAVVHYAGCPTQTYSEGPSHVQTVEHYKTLYDASQSALRDALRELTEAREENERLRRVISLGWAAATDHREGFGLDYAEALGLFDKYHKAAHWRDLFMDAAREILFPEEGGE